MKKYIIMVILCCSLFQACVKEVRVVETKAAELPYPSADEKKYQEAKALFILYEKELLKEQKYKTAFITLKDYFKALKKVEQLKNIYIENMKTSILINNETALLDQRESKREKNKEKNNLVNIKSKIKKGTEYLNKN